MGATTAKPELNPEDPPVATINYLTTVQFDFGAIKLVGDECKRLNIKRPLIVTDRGIRATGLLDRLREHLDPALGFEVYDGTPPNPTEAAALEAVAQYRKVNADGIIAIGGGSSLDLGKAVALLATIRDRSCSTLPWKAASRRSPPPWRR